MIMEFIDILIGCLVGGWIALRFIRRKRGKAAQRGVFMAGLRVVSGRQSGLSAEWLIGEWSISSGRLNMDAVVVPVIEIVAGSRRSARLSEIVGIDDTIIVTIRTETAVLEWSTLRRFEDLALRALGMPESTAAPLGG